MSFSFLRPRSSSIFPVFRVSLPVLLSFLAIEPLSEVVEGYFRGRRQRQSRARHTKLLHAMSASTRHVSSAVRGQSGDYSGTSSDATKPHEAPRPASYPVVRYSAPPTSASCGLPGCATTYERQPSVSISHAEPTRYLPITHEAFQTVSYVDRALTPSVSIIDRQPSSIDSRQPPSPLTTGSAKLASAPSMADIHAASVSIPASASATSISAASSGRIRPAHSVTDYNRRDFSRSAVPGSVYNLHVTY